MSNQPKEKPISKAKVIERLINDNRVLSAELIKHQDAVIKLPLNPTIEQINNVIGWCNDSIKQIKEIPVLET